MDWHCVLKCIQWIFSYTVMSPQQLFKRIEALEEDYFFKIIHINFQN